MEMTAAHLAQWLVPLLALFKGRLIDRAEQNIGASMYSTGGPIKHEVHDIARSSAPDTDSRIQVFALNGIILLVVKLEYKTKGGWEDSCA